MSWFANEAIMSGVISGVLSMFGGLFGALGAYLVAINQIKKQFKKQDKDRVIELKINKLNESLELFNDFLSKLNVMRGLIYDVELNINNSKRSGASVVSKGSIFKDDSSQKIKDKKHEIIAKKDSIKTNKIFLPTTIKLDVFFEKITDFIRAYKSFNDLFKNLEAKGSMRISEVNENFEQKVIQLDNSYKKLDKEVQEMIYLIEAEMKTLLKV